MRNYNTDELFGSTEDLQTYVNVNSQFPIDKIRPFVRNAVRQLIRPIVGNELLASVFADEERKDRFKQVVAPLAVMLATHELSVNFGDNGHTVSGSKTLLPASDVKVSAYRDACYHRGYAELESWLQEEFAFKSGNFLTGPDDLESLLGIRVTHPYLLFDMLENSFADIAQWQLNRILTGDQYDSLFEGSADNNPEWKQLLLYVKKFIVKQAFVKAFGAGMPQSGPGVYTPELPAFDIADMKADTAMLLDLIRATVVQLEESYIPENEDETHKKHFSCIC